MTLIVFIISTLGTGTTEKITPIIPKIIATTGIEINPVLFPCEFDAMTTITIEETTVAIVDFFIIPTYSGKKPNRTKDIVVTVCTNIFPKLNLTKSKHFFARKILIY